MPQAVLPIVNISKLYVAHLLTETDETATYETPKYFEGIKELGIKVKESADPYYHEGRKILTDRTLQDIDITINITDLTDEEESYLMGHKLAKTGGVIKNDNDIAPTVALLYEADKQGGGKRYGVLYAGTFGISDEDYKDKEGKANFQYKKLQASFRPLRSGLWNYKVDSDSPNVTEDTLKNFFTKVLIPEANTSVGA